MTTHYQALGVAENASQDEIKKAYRNLANKHHPDKGGDQAKFKDISVAYDTIGDPQKRAQYDQERQFANNPHAHGQQFHFHTGNMNDIFGQMFGGAGGPFGDVFGGGFNRARGNRDLNIQCQITLLDSYQGKQLEAQYQLPSGRMQTVVINVPAGIDNGATIRYRGLGDDSIPNIARGDLNVTIIIQSDQRFERRGNDLYTVVELTPIEAMTGVRKTVTNITGATIDLEIRPGVTSGVEFAQGGNGFPNTQGGARGRFVSIVSVKAVPVTDPDLVIRLKTLDAEINQRR
jgi:curved DNA-binding protein